MTCCNGCDRCDWVNEDESDDRKEKKRVLISRRSKCAQNARAASKTPERFNHSFMYFSLTDTEVTASSSHEQSLFT